MYDYATIVFPNGYVLKFRLRDTGRYKTVLLSPRQGTGSDALADFMVQHPGSDYDDCDAQGFAVLLDFLMNR
jgi:hypothetical protein